MSEEKKPNSVDVVVDPDAIIQEGKTIAIRTVTHMFVGTIRRVVVDHQDHLQMISLYPAIWIAETGARLGALFREGFIPATEAEWYPGVCVVFAGGIIDVVPWELGFPKDPEAESSEKPAAPSAQD